MSFSVVLQAAGGSAIGVGHLSRTATLANALSKTEFWEKVVLLWETTPELAARFRPAKCEVMVVPDSQAALTERSRICQQKGVCVLVTDLLNVQPEDVVTAKSQGYQGFVHINDSGIGRFVADMLIDADAFKSPEDLPISFTGVGLIGAPYLIIRESIAQLRPLAPWQGERVSKVLITLGGADPENLTLQLVRSLLHQDINSSFCVTTVIGPAFNPSQVSQLELIANINKDLRILKSPNSLAQLMLDHDLIVTLGGITSYEAMCLGKPCAVVAWGPMKYYVEQLSLIGLLKDLGEVKNAAMHLFKFIQNIDLLHKIARAGWQNVDGKGVDRIVDKISKLAEQIASKNKQ
ncbi:UDP-2,4-diacetamido-2,4,6-trideoxy-beta-L-altropyranose hydrolase [Scytonema sp. NUACC21]